MNKISIGQHVAFEYGYFVRVNNEITGQYPVYGSNGITGYIDSYKVEGPGVIIGRKGSVGKITYAKSHFTPTDTAYYLRLLDTNKDDMCFWFYFLGILGLEKLNTHSAVPGLSRSIAYSLEVQIPEKIEQLKIAKVLSILDSKIELNNRINTELEAMAKLIYDYWFVQFDFPDANGKPYKSSGGKMVYSEALKREIPKGWNVKELGELIEFERGISYKSNEISESGTPMINLNSFSLTGRYKSKGLKYFSGSYRENKVVATGDLVIAITDVTRNADIIGKAFTIPALFDRDILISCDVAKIVPSNLINNQFLEPLFNSSHYHNYIKYFASGTLVLHLNLDGVKWCKIPLPPKSLLDKYSELRKNIDQRITLSIKENQQLIKLRDWLLPMLMNGQVIVKDSNCQSKEGKLKHGSTIL